MTAPSDEGRRNYDLSETADDITRGHELSGISSIDDQSIPAHLPTAIKGLGSVERTLWFQAQREREKVESEKTRAERRAALEASQKRLQTGVDDHFTGRAVETLEVKEGHSGLLTKRQFTGKARAEEESALAAAAEKEAAREEKRAKKKAKKKQAQDMNKLSFLGDEEHNDLP